MSEYNLNIMLRQILSDFYSRDIQKFIDEINAFKDERHIWQTTGSVKNSSGNLALHIIGGTNYLIGTTLAQTGYVRNRDQEFIKKVIDRKVLVAELEKLIPLIRQTLERYTDEDMAAEYPIPFDDKRTSKSYVLVQLLAHLNYHLGQVNYLRRMLEPPE
jgi:hypothetical protein